MHKFLKDIVTQPTIARGEGLRAMGKNDPGLTSVPKGGWVASLNSLRKSTRGWLSGSVAKGTYSCRGPGLDPQYPCGGSQLSAAPVPGKPFLTSAGTRN